MNIAICQNFIYLIIVYVIVLIYKATVPHHHMFPWPSMPICVGQLGSDLPSSHTSHKCLLTVMFLVYTIILVCHLQQVLTLQLCSCATLVLHIAPLSSSWQLDIFRSVIQCPEIIINLFFHIPSCSSTYHKLLWSFGICFLSFSYFAQHDTPNSIQLHGFIFFLVAA